MIYIYIDKLKHSHQKCISMIRWCECTSCFAGKSNLSSTLTSPVQSQSLIPTDLVGCIPQKSGWIVNYWTISYFTNKNTFNCEQSWCVFGLCVWPHCFIQKLLILDVILPPHPPAKVHHLQVHHSFCCTTCGQIHRELPGVEIFFQGEMVALLRHGCFYLSYPMFWDTPFENWHDNGKATVWRCTSISYWEIDVFLLSCLFSGVYKKTYPKPQSAPRFWTSHFGTFQKPWDFFPEDHTLPQHPIKGYKGCASEDGWSHPMSHSVVTNLTLQQKKNICSGPL